MTIMNDLTSFTYKKTSKEVEEYFINLLGRKKAKKLTDAMGRREFIIISGPHGATGKTMLADVLRAIGYSRVIEEYETTTILVSEPLKELRERSSIFKELGISLKRYK